MATNKTMINRFKDMAELADAAYAKLDFVFENVDSIFLSKKWEDSDNITLGDRIKENIVNSKGNALYKQNSNTAYVRCIEANFMRDKVVD